MNEQTDSQSYRDIRIEKLNKIRELGKNPYPERFERTHSLKEAKELPLDTEDVRITGRIFTSRVMGKLTFVNIIDFSGKMQIALERDTVGKENYDYYKKYFDIGDFIGCEGKIFKTRTGEITLLVSKFEMLSKSLRPLPEKWHGVTDRETLYRQRYLDMIMNRETIERFKFRSRFIKGLRKILEEYQFEEVETPVLQTKPSGAIAKPFVTHHNALDIDVFMRIAPETYLKRLILGGYERVYEFARCFRNEGMDPSHLQDFTMLEWYAAYWNYEDNMNFTKILIQKTLEETLDSVKITYADKEIDFSGEWPRVTFKELLLDDLGIDIDQYETADDIRALIKEKNIQLEDVEIAKLGRGNLIDVLYKKVSRPKLINPVFLTSHPIDLSPLARKNDDNPQLTDRFQLVVNGWEVVNAYSELVDPIDQMERFVEQQKIKSGGDEEALEMEDDYVKAMEYGMPPMSGFGMGIDRMVALLTDQDNLRDVIFFPLMRPSEL